jgi:hypothetical protein
MLLWPITRLSNHPESIKVLNLCISTGTVYLISRYTPVSLWIRVAFSLGYYSVYEYGTISRNYSLGLLLLAAFCALFPYRHTRPFVIGSLLLLVANSSMLACILAIAATITLAIEALTIPPKTLERKNIWGGIFIALIGIILAIYQMIPPPDSGYAMGWYFEFDPAKLKNILQKMSAAYLPLPKPGPDFWKQKCLITSQYTVHSLGSEHWDFSFSFHYPSCGALSYLFISC